MEKRKRRSGGTMTSLLPYRKPSGKAPVIHISKGDSSYVFIVFYEEKYPLFH
jgi:hypothetical protein